ncbi:MAG: hypothetical protein ACJAT7_002756 [Psychromonas sp.]|jgi:hypothetical protein|uniref:hypothetical protein n=1 Tax=Psychromonas sp. TaxID=1884585 RepID=UPI0039E2EFD4
MNNLALTTPCKSTRGLLLIGVDMAPGKDESIVRNLNKARHFADKAQRILTKNEDAHSVCNMVNAIMSLAVLNSELLHIHTRYSPHVKTLDVRVQPADTDYENPAVVFKEHIYLDKPKSLEQLKNLEDLLIELVADAKDLAMGGC